MSAHSTRTLQKGCTGTVSGRWETDLDRVSRAPLNPALCCVFALRSWQLGSLFLDSNNIITVTTSDSSRAEPRAEAPQRLLICYLNDPIPNEQPGTAMTKEYCLGEEYDHADIVVVAGKGHSDAGKSERDEDCISYCKVNKGSLMLYSTTFRDMFDVAGTGGIDGERIEGLPFITLHEEPEPLCQFLSFFNEDADRWSQCNTLEYRDLILIWTMSLKYDTKHVRYFCEREMRYAWN